MALRKIFAQRPAGLVAVLLVAAGALVVLALASAVGMAAKSAKDSVVSEIRIDDEGVRIGDETYERGGITVRIGDDDEDINRIINVEGESVVRFGDDVIVSEGELIQGDAVAILGSVLVNGIVEGDAVAVGGSVTVGPSGRIDGDGVAIGGGVHREPGAVIRGESVSVGKGGNWSGYWKDDRYIGRNLPYLPHRSPFPWGLFSRTGRLLMWIIWTLVVVLLAALVTLVARRPVETISIKARREAFKMGLIGLIAWLLLGPVMLLFIVTIIGIPVGLIVIPLLFCIALLVGYTAVGLAVGERFIGGNGKSPYASVMLGIVMLQAINIIAGIVRLPGSWLGVLGWIIAAIGFAVIFVAATVGLGAAIMTRFGTAKPKPAEGVTFVAPPPAGV